MCRAKNDPDCPGGRRCPERTHYHVNQEGHERQIADPKQERHWLKPKALLSMTANAIRIRRHRARKYAAEVDAMRTVHGLREAAPLGPVLRTELWSHRYIGAGLSLRIQADQFKAIAKDEGVEVDEIAARYAKQQVIPHRQSAGERLSALVSPDPERPDWCEPDYLVRPVEPLDNGTLNPAYLWIVRDLDGKEFALVKSYDGSEPLAWPHDDAGLMAAMSETLDRVRAAEGSEEYRNAYAPDFVEHANPWTQDMDLADFLATDGVHLV